MLLKRREKLAVKLVENRKMKLYKKFLLILIVINVLINLSHLSEVKADFISDMEKSASSFVSKGQEKAEDGNGLNGVTNTITKNFSGLGQLLTMVGAGVMVAVVSYMGIQYIMAPPDKQAALKQQLIGVVVAGIVIFGAYGIWKAVLGVVSNF